MVEVDLMLVASCMSLTEGAKPLSDMYCLMMSRISIEVSMRGL